MTRAKITFASLLSTLVMFLSIEIFLVGQTFAQFEYKDQFGKLSIQVPQNWTISSSTVKDNSVAISIDSSDQDPVTITMIASNRGTRASQDTFEQVIREQNRDTVTSLPGATLVQDTDCTKYTIDGHKTCSVVYTVSRGQYTQKNMDLDFVTDKQDFTLSVTGPIDNFDKNLPIVEKILYSIKSP
ncbi:MAG TPA: hypothetical protein VE089_08635 [Nitrososphaeraceae archaeon]|nr:hypothetical protein [Nitrososphaeraceae archaeon]